MLGSKNNYWLNLANAGKSILAYWLSLRFTMPQNYLGLYLSISGRVLENVYFPLKHACLYALNATLASSLPLPLDFLDYMYFDLRARHSSVNHGAKCLPHLFGLSGYIYSRYFTTPAVTPSSIKKRSTFLDLSALLYCVFSTNDLKLDRNSGFSVCYFQILALAAYSWTALPSCHIYQVEVGGVVLLL